MVEGGACGSYGEADLRATETASLSYRQKAQPDIGKTLDPSQESFFTEEDRSSHATPYASCSIRRTRSAARVRIPDLRSQCFHYTLTSADKNSSLLASDSLRNVGMSPLRSSTPLRARADVNVKTNVTPHLDHVLSFHQKVSPSIMSPDIFTPTALKSDTPESRDSGYSCFGNWRFYSTGPGVAFGSGITPNTSDDTSLCDSDSSDGGHQVFLLPQPCFAPSAARSAPYVSAEHNTSENKLGADKPCVVSRKRSKSLSALPGPAISVRRERPKSLPITDTRGDHLRALSMNSSYEAMHFATQLENKNENIATSATLATFEIVSPLDQSARNGKRSVAGTKMFTRPIQKLQKSVRKLLS